MKYCVLILFTGFICLTACTTSKVLTSGVSSSEITGLKLMEPYSYITMIRKGNRGQLDDSVSAISKQLVFKTLKNFEGKIPISGEIILRDTAVNKTLEKEFEYLMLTADKKKSISDLRLTPMLDKILETNETRFGLIIITSGFTRVKGNYGKEVAKGAAMGILTLGMYYQTPVKAYSTIYAMIADSRDDNIAFYKKSFRQDTEPLDMESLMKQYEKIFAGYFWPSK